MVSKLHLLHFKGALIKRSTYSADGISIVPFSLSSVITPRMNQCFFYGSIALFSELTFDGPENICIENIPMFILFELI